MYAKKRKGRLSMFILFGYIPRGYGWKVIEKLLKIFPFSLFPLILRVNKIKKMKVKYFILFAFAFIHIIFANKKNGCSLAFIFIFHLLLFSQSK